MQSKAATVSDYLAGLPEDRSQAIQAVRKVILANLGKGYQEGMQYGMIGYFVPHSVYPAGYHCDPKQPLPFAGLASQKNHMSVYLMCTYGNVEHLKWFHQAWAKTGKKLDMGKSCIRFKRVEDLALDVIGEAIQRVPVRAFIEHYERAILTSNKAAAAKRGTVKKAAAAKAPAKTVRKTTAKKAAKAGVRRAASAR
ncbi:MAG: DUF1801 domain-containing protein [Phycisphaeraceae bacterium]|nr:DUF1801 domain-containing protein [Phycisphaeraceae bacterium]